MFWGAALLTKGFALVMPPAIIAAYLVGPSGRLRHRIAQTWRPIAICGGIGALLGGWWWVRNVIVYSVVQPDGYGPLSAADRRQIFGVTAGPGTEIDLFFRFFILLGERVWGSLGLIDLPTASTKVPALVAVVTVGFVVIAIAGAREQIGWRPSRSITLCLPLVLTIAVMYFGTRTAFLQGSVLPGVQARYLLPTMLGVSLCVTVGLRRCAGRWRDWVPPILLTATLIYVGYSAFLVLDIEMSPPDSGSASRLVGGARFVADWAPWDTGVSIALAAAAGLAGLVALAAFWSVPLRRTAPVSASAAAVGVGAGVGPPS